MRRISALTVCTVALAAAPFMARAAPLTPDPSGVWTLQDENASISTNKVTDRYYVNGLHLGYTSRSDALPEFLNGIAGQLWGEGQRRWSFDLTQQIYTPFTTNLATPPAGDRPYAGVLMGTFGLNSDTETSRSYFGVGIGVIGPAALGEQVQNGFHDLIGQAGNRGWRTQLKNEPVIQITSSRVFRLKTGSVFGLETEALPELTAGAGTQKIYALTGVTLRIGQGLDSDFGVSRVRPGPSGGDVFRPTSNFAWYVFAGLDGQAIAHDITLDGTIFRSGPSVKKHPFVGEAQAGLALLIHGVKLSYTHVIQTQQFKGQHGGWHQFGSINLSVRF
jgi:hypothetical protein